MKNEKDLSLKSLLISTPSGNLEEYISNGMENNESVFAFIISYINKNNFYKVFIDKKFILAIPKKLRKNIKLIVSHIDNTYEKCFIKKQGKFYIGTFDNLIGVYTSLSLLNNNYDDVIFCYTDCEETDMSGIKELNIYAQKKLKAYSYKYIVLDVSEEKVNVSTTIENSNLEINENKDVKIIENEMCGYDESKYLLKQGNIKTCSICAVLLMRNEKDYCHNEEGNYIKVSNIKKYKKNVKEIIERKV